MTLHSQSTGTPSAHGNLLLHPPVPGRPLLAFGTGTVYVARGYRIFCTKDRGHSWTLDSVVAAPRLDRLAADYRFIARISRRQIVAFRVLADGSRIAIARDGIYRANAGETELHRTFRFAQGRPLGFAVAGEGRLLFGDYFSNPERGPVNVYLSEDGGRSFHPVHRFPANAIRHVHALLWDPYLERCLILTGDYGDECGIGVFDDDLTRVTWLTCGDQRARAAAAIVGPDSIIYGTDSQIERNCILRLDKRSGRIEELQSVEGSSLFAARFGETMAITTCVEPSPVNHGRDVSLYLSRDGATWRSAVSFRKDMWHSKLQFGTLVLPFAETEGRWCVFGGQAVKGADGRTFFLSADE